MREGHIKRKEGRKEAALVQECGRRQVIEVEGCEGKETKRNNMKDVKGKREVNGGAGRAGEEREVS